MDAGWAAHMVAVEIAGEPRAYVSLDDLGRLAMKDSVDLGTVLGQLRTVFESWEDRTGGVYVRKT